MAETNTWNGVERMADDMKKRKLGVEEDGPVLANMVQAALAEPKKGFAMYTGGSVAEAMRRNMQADMATMQKFMVDNTLLDEIVKASFVKPQTLLAMLHRAMPCFDSMWVEWDEHARLESRKKAHDKYTPDMYIQFNDRFIDGSRVGYHIRKVNDKIIYAKYQITTQNGVEQIGAYPLGFSISNSDRMFSDQNEMLASNYNQVTSDIIFAPWYYAKHSKDPVQREYLDDIMFKCGIVQTAAMHWSIPAQKFKMGWEKDEMSELVRRNFLPGHGDEQGFGMGDVRFLIALLSTLNYDQVIHLSTTPPKKIDHMRFGRVVPKNEYKLVTIQLPKPRGVKIYEQMFTGHGTPKREHWVRGHHRRIRGRSEPTWIPPHIRGNPELGTIVHDYKLEAK
tara:strand:+ start:1247 stop:2425 length:1179 start_codon:yes stop_codon:yes gene_type:complete